MTRVLRLAALSWAWLAVPAVAENSIAVAERADVVAIARTTWESRLLRVRLAPGAPPRFERFGPTGVGAFAVGARGELIAYIRPKERDYETDAIALLDGAGQPLGAPVASSIGDIRYVIFSPRGDTVAVVAKRGWVEILAVQGTGAARRLVSRTIFATDPGGAAVAYLPDGAAIGVISDKRVLTIRDLDGRVQRALDLARINGTEFEMDLYEPDDEPGKLGFSPHGDTFAIVVGGGPIWVAVFDRDGRVMPGWKISNRTMASSFRYLPDGKHLLTWGMQDPRVIPIDGSEPKPVKHEFEFGTHEMVVMNDGKSVAVRDGRHRIALLSLDGRRLVEEAGFENYRIGGIELGAEGELIASVARGSIQLYTKAGAFIRQVPSGTYDGRTDVALSADATVIAALGYGVLGVSDSFGNAKWRSAWSYFGLQYYVVAVAADGSRIATLGPQSEIRSWSRDGRAEILPPLRDGGIVPKYVRSLAVSRDGALIAIGDDAGSLWLVAADTGSVVRVPGASSIRALAFAPDGITLAVGDGVGTVRLLGLDGKEKAPAFNGAQWGGVAELIFAPDGQRVLAIEEDRLVARVLAADGRPVAGPFRPADRERIVSGFFASDGVWLVIHRRAYASHEEDSFLLKRLEGGRAKDLMPPGR